MRSFCPADSVSLQSLLKLSTSARSCGAGPLTVNDAFSQRKSTSSRNSLGSGSANVHQRADSERFNEATTVTQSGGLRITGCSQSGSKNKKKKKERKEKKRKRKSCHAASAPGCDYMGQQRHLVEHRFRRELQSGE